MPKTIKVVISILVVLICSVALAQVSENATSNTKIKDPNYKPNPNIQTNAPVGAIPLASWSLKKLSLVSKSFLSWASLLSISCFKSATAFKTRNRKQ